MSEYLVRGRTVGSFAKAFHITLQSFQYFGQDAWFNSAEETTEITISPESSSCLATSIVLALYPFPLETSVDYLATVIYQENANTLSGGSLTCGDLVRLALFR